jgi:predicted  nucleic acid-binding Zn-ribbon protein
MDERDDVRKDLSTDEQALQAQVQESEAELQQLEHDLHQVDGELAKLVEQNRKFEALGDVCRSLEQLGDLGGTELFWKPEAGDVTEYIEHARDRIHEFGDNFVKVEKRRDKIMHRIGSQNYALDCLHYELLDAMEREETRRAEWVVEREAEELPAHEMVMPWQRGQEEDRRYRKSLGSSLAISLMLGVLLSSIAIPIPDRQKMIELPERMAKLVH